MGLLIVAGLGVLGATFVQRLHSAGRADSTDAVSGFGRVDLTLPAGATIAEMAVEGDRLVVRLEGAAGPRILILDLATGRQLGELHFRPAP